ncbi:MAG TPA: tetratricopeptide repeat protein [Spirochaetia bacterium]|nr:tetratricopeptide repeat protein [Spirochaetia bacterium]
MRKFLVLTGFLLVVGVLGAGLWAAWPILFPPVPSGWLSTLSKADAALLQNRPDLARAALTPVPKGLPVGAWLQWEKRVQAVAQKTGNWTWAAQNAAAARAQYPGNTDLTAYLVWTLVQDHRASEASTLADKVLKGTGWDSLATQARVEAADLASGDWSGLRATLAEPTATSLAAYGRLVTLDDEPGLRKNALLAALSQGRLDQARDHLSALTPAQRDQPPFDRLQGLMAYDQGDWTRAAALLKSLAQARPDTLMVLADVYLHLGDGDQARIVYDQMLADHPDNLVPALAVNRATLALDQGDPAKAMELLTKVSSDGPGVDQVKLLTLEARFRLGESDAVKTALDGLVEKGNESPLALDAELLKGRLFPDWNSVPRLWSLVHRHPVSQPLVERLAWSLVQTQDFAGAHRALDLHLAALKKAGVEVPWWVSELRALLFAVEDRLPEASEAFDTVPAAWRDATFYADWALVALTQAQQADPQAKKPLLDASLERLTRGLDLLPPSSEAQALVRRSLWLTRRAEVETSLLPYQNPGPRGTLRSAAAEDLRQAVQLDPDNLRASFLLRQAQASPQESP